MPKCVIQNINLWALLLLCSQSFAQQSEIGAGLGAFNYTGDITRTYDITTLRPAVTAFYRTNISQVVSFRMSLTGGQISGSDKDNPLDSAAIKRNASFSMFLFEVSGAFEYHFLDWRSGKSRLRYTPYLFAGVGLFGISGYLKKPTPYSNVQLCIPFGGGIKYELNRKYYLSAEFGIRKTFFSYLDNTSQPVNKVKDYQYGSSSGYDNYFFTAITLTYVFYDIICPSSPYRDR